jgi:DNA adenine methylase
MGKLRPPIKIHGGKWYHSGWVIEHFPKGYDKLPYCELCCGGASVLLNKLPAQEELVADVDLGIINIFKSLRDEPKEFIDKLKKIKYKESSFLKALERSKETFDDYVEHAVNDYVLRRMSRGGMKKAFAWSERLRGGKPGDLNAWNTMLKQLPAIAQRVNKIAIIHGDVIDVAKVWDDENLLIYLDPPYLPETRSEGSREIYGHEMTMEQHVNLLNFVKDARSKIILSGYSSPLYNRCLKGWKVVKKEVVNHSSQQDKKTQRTEVLWMNY